MKSSSVADDRFITPREQGGAELEPTGAGARSRAETRRRLLEAGIDHFARVGLAGTTTTQIARAAGVAAGTFYLHFPDKLALFRTIAFAALADLRARTEAANDAAGRDPVAQLRARMTTLVAFADEKRDLVRILFGRGPEAGELGAEIADELFPGVEARLREAARAGLVDPALHPAATAQALIATWIRVVAWWADDPARAPQADVVETLVRLHPVFHRPSAR